MTCSRLVHTGTAPAPWATSSRRRTCSTYFGRYLTAAASVASQGTQLPLPPTGMKVEIPIVSTITNLLTKQSSDNASISSMDPEATYSTQAVNTYAGYALVSQQLFDRFGGINGNGLTFDQAFAKLVARQAGTALDTDIITAITGAAQTVTNSGSATFGAFLGDVAKAIVDIETEAGQELPVSHVWVPSYNLRWLQAQLGTNNQPVWAPSPNGTGGRVGRLDASNEGYSGYDIAGAMVFQNANLPTTGGSSAYNSILVGNARGVPAGAFERPCAGRVAAGLRQRAQRHRFRQEVRGLGQPLPQRLGPDQRRRLSVFLVDVRVVKPKQ